MRDGDSLMTGCDLEAGVTVMTGDRREGVKQGKRGTKRRELM